MTAICTGKKDANGMLNCSELVTKCPSKYESGVDALSVSGLLDYGEKVLNKPVKVAGVMKAGTLAGVDAAERFVIVDEEAGKELRVKYEGALSDETAEGSNVVLTGSVDKDGLFVATDVALEG